MQTHIKSAIDFLESQNTPTVNLAAFKKKKPPTKIVKDLSTVVNAVKEVQKPTTVENGVKKQTKPLKNIPTKTKDKKEKVVWL